MKTNDKKYIRKSTKYNKNKIILSMTMKLRRVTDENYRQML